LLGGLYVIGTLTALRLWGFSCGIWPAVGWGFVLVAAPTFCLLLGRTVWHLWRFRPEHPFGSVWRDWRFVTRERGMVALPILLGYPVFMASFTVFKAHFPFFGQYHWDPALSRLDGVLHGGLPGRFFAPWLGRLWFIIPIDRVYCSWALLNMAVLGWMAFSLDFRLRRRFWTAFVLCWLLLGTVMALAFLSAGPCFYDQVSSGGPYLDQMATLRQVNESVLLTSIRLQNVVRTHVDAGAVAAASAMPSMHISMCALFTLAGWHRHRKLGLLLLAVTLLTQVACVALGWHYAIDGYVAAAGTCLIWWAVGKAT
jgi:hypothetical protein